MQITNLFKKKEETKEEKSAPFTPVKVPPRDKKGRFLPKKENKEKTKEKKEEKPEILSVTFFGKEVRKAYAGGKWYFAIDDIYNIAYPPKEGEVVKTTEEFEKIKKEVTKEFEGILFAEAEGIKKLIEEIKGVFPGPFTRWLDESAQLPFVPPPKEEKKENE
ncbi:MAG: hypothetical protein KatS3mg088_777 [Patescibacteria group bacterium]|nr:MAG: hypothetical protein KatS3mg088_777 [Patescibacteria group bacterium]